MRKRHLTFACGLAFVVSANAFAGENQGSNTQVKTEPVKQHLICRAPVSNGTLIPRAKQCYTKAEWEARQKRMQNSVRNIQMQNLLQQKPW